MKLPDRIELAGLSVVLLAWFVFALTFVLRKRPPKAPVAKRDPASRWGIALQALAYAVLWTFQKWFLPSMISAPLAVQDGLAILAGPLAIVSAWLAIAAVRTLGKQWSLEARLAEGHRLIVAGPYSYMRHPIYTAMLGMLVATGLAITHWLALTAAVVVYSLGTAIRIRAEEKLLRGAFAEDFVAYARHVPAILPRFHITGARTQL